MRLTAEREKKIREKAEKVDYLPSKLLRELLQEIDALRAETVKLQTHTEAMRQLEKVSGENQRLRARIEKLREALTLYVVGDENGMLDDAGVLGVKTLTDDRAQDNETEREG
jgi:regulator of replication initiation timing